VRADRRLAAELAASAAVFYPGPRPPGAAAARRHAEWFLFERPSAALEGVPGERLADRWRALARPGDRARIDAFQSSHAGVFEVTGVAPGDGAWLRDLLGLGEYPLEEALASQDLAVGDVLVGRLYPIGSGQFVASPAASVFRNAELLAALRRDLERMRAARRGSLRVSQAELERMFFALPAVAPDAERRFAAAVEVLTECGIERAEAEGAVRGLVETPWDASGALPGANDALGALLDRLAFDTGVDLERARRALLAAWQSAAEARSQASASPAPAPNASPRSAGRTGRARVRNALEAFDRGRASGRDLERLFSELESDLGLEPGSTALEDDDGTPAAGAPPVFPGLVGALLAEYRWELEQRDAERTPALLEPLARLERSAADVGQIEDLDGSVLLDCAARSALEERSLASEAEAEALVSALQEFARWCDETQGLRLEREFAPLAQALASSLPRLAVANRGLSLPVSRAAPLYVLEADAGGELVARRADGSGGSGAALRLELDESRCTRLRAGDLVRGRTHAGRLQPMTFYPREARALLGEHGRRR
jgi:hypothetical protein